MFGIRDINSKSGLCQQGHAVVDLFCLKKKKKKLKKNLKNLNITHRYVGRMTSVFIGVGGAHLSFSKDTSKHEFDG